MINLSLTYHIYQTFEKLNFLNLKLQGQKNILKTYDAVKGFTEKIALWQCCLQSSELNFSSCPRLNDLLDDTKNFPLYLINELKNFISGHLVALKNEIEDYFPDVSSENWEFKLTRDPFKIDVDILPDHIQVQAIDLKCNSQANAELTNKDVEDFWLSFYCLPTSCFGSCKVFSTVFIHISVNLDFLY
ncbi:general transcription factor II-I repeat domain-containing protein 2-like [Lycorma delicatula]|uniref:general transcription factor II-I repeat domain-containing protein 2-like n=1 Tax=Lycorma delicatula TaxID=130591 RepID=UPI003F51598F